MSRVAVLKGGRSLERSVSLQSGRRVEDALRKLGHEVIGIDVNIDLISELRSCDPDSVFLALHGPGGEDGTVQELLELLGIPYTGSGPNACMHCSDKVLTKHAIRSAGIQTPDFFSFSESAFKRYGAAEALTALQENLRFPVVVKPASQGSALGVKLASNDGELTTALMAAFSYDSKVLVEHYVPGRDLSVSILASTNDNLEALPIVEAHSKQGAYDDFESRYQAGSTEFICPADLPKELTEEAQKTALKCFEVLGCRGVARVDMMLSSDSTLDVLEVDTVPGLTDTSLLPQAASKAGLAFTELIDRLLATTTR